VRSQFLVADVDAIGEHVRAIGSATGELGIDDSSVDGSPSTVNSIDSANPSHNLAKKVWLSSCRRDDTDGVPSFYFGGVKDLVSGEIVAVPLDFYTVRGCHFPTAR
jgi:hypothetical protein